MPSDLAPHILSNAGREPVVETRIDARHRHFVSIGPNIGPACVTPGAVGLAIVTSGMSGLPNTVSITVAMLALLMQWAHGYSGCIGVLSIGCQVGSSSVAALSSMSPLRMAVIGRQKS